MRTSYYSLVFAVLDWKWRYFFNSPTSTDELSAEHTAEFTGLLQIVASALQATDIETVQLNLQQLQLLNDRHKLFQRVRMALRPGDDTEFSLIVRRPSPLSNSLQDAFRTGMLNGFLSILLTLLLGKSHELLSEEILVAIHDLAVHDLDGFYNSVRTGPLAE